MVVKQRLRTYLLGILLVVATAFFFTTSLSSYIFSCCLYPWLLMQHTIVMPLQQWWHNNDVVVLQAQLKAVCKERDMLLERYIAAQATASFYDQIHEVVEFKQQYAVSPQTLAQIVLKQFSEHEHVFFVNKGARDGIVPDMVALYHNHLVGRVIQVFPYYSKVVAITDKTCKVAAYCAKTKANGIYEGVHSLTETALNHVSHLQQVEEGDLVISSGDGLVFPQGFALGTIQVVTLDGVQYKISVRPAIDVSTLLYCYLMQKGAENRPILQEVKPVVEKQIVVKKEKQPLQQAAKIAPVAPKAVPIVQEIQPQPPIAQPIIVVEPVCAQPAEATVIEAAVIDTPLTQPAEEPASVQPEIVEPIQA